MAEREMSGKALLDKLYSGLDTMPAVEAEMNARDLRRLTDDFLGRPPEETQRYVLAEIDRWSAVVRDTGVTME